MWRADDAGATLLWSRRRHRSRRAELMRDENVALIIGIVAQADLATRLGRPEQHAQVIEAISDSENAGAARM